MIFIIKISQHSGPGKISYQSHSASQLCPTGMGWWTRIFKYLVMRPHPLEAWGGDRVTKT